MRIKGLITSTMNTNIQGKSAKSQPKGMLARDFFCQRADALVRSAEASSELLKSVSCSKDQWRNFALAELACLRGAQQLDGRFWEVLDSQPSEEVCMRMRRATSVAALAQALDHRANDVDIVIPVLIRVPVGTLLRPHQLYVTIRRTDGAHPGITLRFDDTAAAEGARAKLLSLFVPRCLFDDLETREIILALIASPNDHDYFEYHHIVAELAHRQLARLSLDSQRTILSEFPSAKRQGVADCVRKNYNIGARRRLFSWGRRNTMSAQELSLLWKKFKKSEQVSSVLAG